MLEPIGKRLPQIQSQGRAFRPAHENVVKRLRRTVSGHPEHLAPADPGAWRHAQPAATEQRLKKFALLLLAGIRSARLWRHWVATAGSWSSAAASCSKSLPDAARQLKHAAGHRFKFDTRMTPVISGQRTLFRMV